MTKRFFQVSAIVFVAVLLLVAPKVQAAEFLSGGHGNGTGGSVTVGNADTHHNLYVAGGNNTINGVTTGDLYIAGGTNTLSGTIERDLVAAGGTVVVAGRVGDDARIAGGTVTVNAPVGGDLLIAGGNVTLSQVASVGGDLVVTGGMVEIDGPVQGNVRLSGGTVVINNAVGGNTWVRASRGLTFGANARIPGAISYMGPSDATVSNGAVIGNISRLPFSGREDHSRKGALAGILSLLFIAKLLATLIASLLLYKLWPRQSQTVVAEMHHRPWSLLGIGALVAIVAPIVAIILLFTVIGYYLALLILAGYFLLMLLAWLLGAMFLGAWVMKLINSHDPLVLTWKAVVVGVIIFYVLMLIPVVGWIIGLLLMLIAFGGLVHLAYEHTHRGHTINPNN